MTIVGLDSVAQLSAARALNSLAEGIALTVLCWIVLRTLAASSSIHRFAAWFFTLLAVAGLPFLVASAPVAGWQRAQLTVSSSWATALFLTWAGIAGLLLLRLAASLWHVRRVQREAQEIKSHHELLGLLKQFAPGRRLRLCVSDKLRVPAALGFFQPSIVLPAWAVDELRLEELKTIVLHELAHLRRWDDWTNLAQKVVKAIFFFHPAVWWIENRLALEREMACDEVVLRETGNPRAYARSLVAVAEKSAQRVRLAKALSLAQNALGRIGEISLRLTEILKPDRPAEDSIWRPGLVAIAALAVAVVAFATMPYAPQLIAFENRSVIRTAVKPLSVPRLVAVNSVLPTGMAASRSSSLPRAVGIRPARLSSVRKTPKTILAKARAGRQNFAQMLIFVEAAQGDGAGHRSWTLCVWRIASPGQGQANVQEAIVVNLI